MPSRLPEPTGNSTPSPFPEGWYFLTSRRILRRTKLIQRTWMGTETVIWCDESGRVCVAEASCPHLGANLGPEAGGRVCDGRLVCPFHGFEFDATGLCVATPFVDPPRSARLRTFETQEVLGLIFAWWGHGGRPPQWSLPTDLPEMGDWSKPVIRTLRFPGHPQETTENAVDVLHLRRVHGYENVSCPEPVVVDGVTLRSRFDFRTSRRIARTATLTFDTSATAHVVGLGYSFVEVRELSIPMEARLWVLATPVDGRLIDLSLVSQVREIRKPGRRIVGLGFLPPPLRAPLTNELLVRLQERDVLQDVTIWSRKQYQSRPRLCRADGEIMTYRRYCAQFYPDLPLTAGSAETDDDRPGA